MKLASGFLLTLVGHVLRLSAGMLIFVLLARQLGPADFGIFSFWLAIATLITIPINYGFGTMVLREFGAAPDRAIEILSNVLISKIALTIAVLTASCLALPWLTQIQSVIFLSLLFCQVVESFSEFYILTFRLKADFRGETINACITSSLHLGIMIAVLCATSSLIISALAFLFSRCLGFVVTYLRSKESAGHVRIGAWQTVTPTLKHAWAYSLEFGVLTLYSQVDTLIIKAVLGDVALGVYQAGMKLIQGASRIAPVLSQILLPELARNHNNPSKFKIIATKTILSFFLFSATGAVIMIIGSHQLIHLLFGHAYDDLVTLIIPFSLLLIARFCETGFGLLLVACNLQKIKVWLVIVQLLALVVVGMYLLNTYGLSGWLWINNLTIFLLVIGYFALLVNNFKSVST